MPVTVCNAESQRWKVHPRNCQSTKIYTSVGIYNTKKGLKLKISVKAKVVRESSTKKMELDPVLKKE